MPQIPVMNGEIGWDWSLVDPLTDSLMQKAVDGGALDVLDEYIRYHQQDHGLCNMVLLTLGSFIDSGKSAVAGWWSSSGNGQKMSGHWVTLRNHDSLNLWFCLICAFDLVLVSWFYWLWSTIISTRSYLL